MQSSCAISLGFGFFLRAAVCAAVTAPRSEPGGQLGASFAPPAEEKALPEARGIKNVIVGCVPGFKKLVIYLERIQVHSRMEWCYSDAGHKAEQTDSFRLRKRW